MVFLSAPSDSKQVLQDYLADDINFEHETMGQSHMSKRKCFDSNNILGEQSQMHMVDSSEQSAINEAQSAFDSNFFTSFLPDQQNGVEEEKSDNSNNVNACL